MPDSSELISWTAVFAMGVAVGALVWRSLTFRWIRDIEEHWKGENADLRERLTRVRVGGATAGKSAQDKQPRKQEATATASESATLASGPDDLTRIKGIGKKIAGMLNDMGVTTYAEIAAWSDADIDRVQEQLQFPGRVRRDKWVERARDEHLRKYGKGVAAA